MQTKIETHDHRKIHREIYGIKPGSVIIRKTPKLKYVAQEMNTAYRMDWAGRPEPIDEKWMVWKIVNQLKLITKTTLDYKFKLMPHEIVWHGTDGNKSFTTQAMQVPDCITSEMLEEAKHKAGKNLKGRKLPVTNLVTAEPVLCAQKLHVGHYRDSSRTLQEIIRFAEEQGYKVKNSHREIYLTPAMKCHEPDTWRTVVIVELDHPIGAINEFE